MKSHRIRKFMQLSALFVLDVLFFGLIDPAKAYAVVVIVGFGLLVATVYVIVDFLLLLIEKLAVITPMARKRLLSGATMLFALLVAMQSIGQLTVKDMFAIVPLVVVVAFYLSYQSRQNSKKA